MSSNTIPDDGRIIKYYPNPKYYTGVRVIFDDSTIILYCIGRHNGSYIFNYIDFSLCEYYPSSCSSVMRYFSSTKYYYTHLNCVLD